MKPYKIHIIWYFMGVYGLYDDVIWIWMDLDVILCECHMDLWRFTGDEMGDGCGFMWGLASKVMNMNSAVYGFTWIYNWLFNLFRGALMVTMVIKYLGGYGNKSSLWLKIHGDGQRLWSSWVTFGRFVRWFFQCVFGKMMGI
jgi:hypothetical protein